MLTALRNTALAAITALVALTAVAGAARAYILVDGFINIAAVEILHVQFVTAARYDTYD